MVQKVVMKGEGGADLFEDGFSLLLGDNTCGQPGRIIKHAA